MPREGTRENRFTRLDSAMTTPACLTCDVLVIGSGAGGLSAAVTAAHLGLSVVVAEKDAHYGGTTAWSGGWMWIPRNPLAVEAGLNEEIEQPLTYLKHELGERFNPSQAQVFLEHGPHMVAFFRDQTALQFIDGNAIPDFHGHAPGAATGGRHTGWVSADCAVHALYWKAFDLFAEWFALNHYF